MSLWDWCIDSDDEQIEEVLIGDTPIIKASPRDYNLHKKVLSQVPLLPQ
jgi:hypothetical protein